MSQRSGLVENELSTGTYLGSAPHTPHSDATSPDLSTLSSELRILERITPLMFQQCRKNAAF